MQAPVTPPGLGPAEETRDRVQKYPAPTYNATGDPPPTPDRGSIDLLLSHGYCLADDEHEREIMMPYPPLGLLYLSSHLKAPRFSVAVHDSTFSTIEEFQTCLDRLNRRSSASTAP